MPGIGRFASADTLVPDPQNPQQFNRYTYSLNSPLRYTDPTGHVCYDPGFDAVIEGNCNGGSTPLLINSQIINPGDYGTVILVGLDKIPRINDDLSRIGTIHVNYRDGFGTLGQQFPGVPISAVIIYNAPVAILINRAGGTNEAYDRSSWDKVTDDTDLLARVMAQEAGGKTTAAQQSELVGVAQVALRRLDTGYADDLRSVLLNRGQFAFTLTEPLQIAAARGAAEYWADPLDRRGSQERYEQALTVAVGVEQGWLYDPRTAAMTSFGGSNGVTTFQPGSVRVTGYPSIPQYR